MQKCMGEDYFFLEVIKNVTKDCVEKKITE